MGPEGLGAIVAMCNCWKQEGYEFKGCCASSKEMECSCLFTLKHGANMSQICIIK